jgi:putative ABC transport system permease protein
MTLTRIILNNAKQRLLSTILTSLSVAVGVALIFAILAIKFGSQERLQLGHSGFDLIVGAKGSPLQLTLNVVYNLDTSPGNIPYSLYEKLAKDPRVKLAVPYSVGDNFKGFRIVGTTDSYLKSFEPRPNQPFELSSGRVFNYREEDLKEAMEEALHRSGKSASPKTAKGQDHHDHHHHDHKHEHEKIFEAVVGSIAAEKTGLKVGDKFVATHGVQDTEEGHKHDESPWTVVGILKSTGTPADRAIFINLDSFYHIEGHVIHEKKSDDHAHAHKEEDKKAEPAIGQISALAIKAKSPIAIWTLRKDLNDRDDAQAAVPAEEIRKLLSIVGNIDRILLTQAFLIVIVASIGTGLAIFNSMNARRRDIAVMRALGARRSTIFSIIVGESILIAVCGAIVGLLLGHQVVALASPIIESATGFPIAGWAFYPFEMILFGGVLVLGFITGIGPAVSAYKTNVATGLTPS